MVSWGAREETNERTFTYFSALYPKGWLKGRYLLFHHVLFTIHNTTRRDCYDTLTYTHGMRIVNATVPHFDCA